MTAFHFRLYDPPLFPPPSPYLATPIQVLPIVTGPGGPLRFPVVASPTNPQPTTPVGVIHRLVPAPLGSPPQPPELKSDSPNSVGSSCTKEVPSQPATPLTPVCVGREMHYIRMTS